MATLVSSSEQEDLPTNEEQPESESIGLLQSRSGRPYLSDSQSSTASSEATSQSSETTIDLSQTYEYPKVVQNLKSVYKDMAITSGLYALNIVSAVGIVLVNKYIYSVFRFNYGVVLTFYHFALTSIGLRVLAKIGVFEPKSVKLLQVLPVSISFCAYVVLTNLSLQYNSGTFYQILVVPTIALLQYLFFGIKTEIELIKTMLFMILGVAVATMTEMKLSLFGLLIAFSGVLMTAIYQILVGTKQKQLGLNAIQLLYYQAPLSTALLMVAAPFLNDVNEVIKFNYSSGLILAIVASALCAFFLNLSMYLVLGRSTALTYNVIGLSKLFLVLALNYVIFESSKVSLMNLVGVLMAFMGMCRYSFQKFQINSQQPNKSQ